MKYMQYGCQLRLESFFESENQHDLFPFLMCKILGFFSVFKGKKLMKYYANAKLMQINIVETKIKFLVRFNFVYKQSAPSPASYWIFDI